MPAARLRWSLPLALPLLALPLWAAAASAPAAVTRAAAVLAATHPRATAERVADLIENNYFDAAAAQRISASLRAAAAAGVFDSLTDPRDLATALTERLRPLNRHFRVSWSPVSSGASAEGRAIAGAATELPDLSPDVMARSTAYGFRSVQILPGNVGEIELQSFADLDTRRADDPARAAADAALQLMSSARAIIIDLRDDIGGSLDMSAYLISAFAPPSADVYDVIHWRDGTESERPRRPYAAPRLQQPLFILTSARTASAAEALAYALQACGRAMIVGDVTAGAADPGGTFPVGDGFAVFVSTGTPVNPLTGHNWEGVGVIPDRRVPAARALELAQQLALARQLLAHPRSPDAPYARRVLEALRALDQPASPGPPLRQYAGTYQDAIVSAGPGGLSLRQGRRLPLQLRRLHGDVFFDRGEPSRRVIFVRWPDGKLRGFELIYANDHLLWFPVGAPTAAALAPDNVH